MSDFIIKQNDTFPAIRAQVIQADDSPVNLSGALVRFIMVDSDGEVVIDEPAEIVEAPEGRIKYAWQQGNTEVVGDYRGEFEATFATGEIVTMPNYTYIYIRIFKELN